MHPLHDYTTITADAIERMTADAISEANTLVDAVATATDDLTYATTLARLEEAGRIMGDVYGRGAFMARVHDDADVRNAAIEAEETLTKWGNDLMFRRDLYETLTNFDATDAAASLTGTKQRLLEHWLRDLRRTGHDLELKARDELQQLKTRLIELEVAFSKNLDEWDDGIELEESDLEGLPEAYIEGLRKTDDGKYRVSMDYPDYIPFIQESPRRDLRQALQFKFWNRAAEANLPLLAEATKLRRTIANMLGYDTWADYRLEVKMAKTRSAVDAFYASVIPGLTTKAQRDLAALEIVNEAEGNSDGVQSWDWAYLNNLQEKREYGVDQNEVAKYFSLDQVIAGMFEITGEVFGLTYEEIANDGSWHPDVKVYGMSNTGESEPFAYFYADLFPRDGKFGHAAAFPIQYGMRLENGSYRKPVAAIVANFTKPTADAPSLLKHSEAETLFHEYGHILHFCLTTVDLVTFSGYDTEWDFVEAPSQIMENWMWKPEILQRFATHHETGEPIPEELVQSLVEARDLNVGMTTIRQVFLGQVDLMMHGEDTGEDLDSIQKRAYAYSQLPYHEGTSFAASFGHLMGGYDAGYYGYLWSSVYGHDMFSEFEKNGVCDPGVGRRYRDEVLAMGGSRDAIDHLRAFLGREPNSDAFLSRMGLSTSSDG